MCFTKIFRDLLSWLIGEHVLTKEDYAKFLQVSCLLLIFS